MEVVLSPPAGSLLLTYEGVGFGESYFMLFGVAVSYCVVSYLHIFNNIHVSCRGLITSVWEERADFDYQ